VDSRLTEWKTASPCPDSHVDEMTFRNKQVFVFSPGTCGADMFTEVYGSDGKLLGNLGGITGKTTIEGEDFDKATQVRRVWSR
jgi:hypothetical protein